MPGRAAAMVRKVAATVVAISQEFAWEEEALKAFAVLEDPLTNLLVEPYVTAVEAMGRCMSNLKVQRAGCFAMAFGSVTWSRFVLKAGGLEAVIAAMSQHARDERVQADGCEALRLLSEAAGGATRVLAAGGLRAALSAMMALGECAVVQQEGLGVLRSISAREATAVINAGGLEAVLRVMEMFRQYSWVQMWGVQALLHLAAVDPRRVYNANGFESAAAAVKRHPDCEVLQRVGSTLSPLRPPG